MFAQPPELLCVVPKEFVIPDRLSAIAAFLRELGSNLFVGAQ